MSPTAVANAESLFDGDVNHSSDVESLRRLLQEVSKTFKIIQKL
jgi:hypothetical protein